MMKIDKVVKGVYGFITVLALVIGFTLICISSVKTVIIGFLLIAFGCIPALIYNSKDCEEWE